MAKQSKKTQLRRPAGKKRPASGKNKNNLLVAHGGPRFTKINYVLMVVGILMLVIGYILVSGGRQGLDEFNSEVIYSARRLTIGPLFILAGFVVEIIAVFYKPAKAQTTETGE